MYLLSTVNHCTVLCDNSGFTAQHGGTAALYLLSDSQSHDSAPHPFPILLYSSLFLSQTGLNENLWGIDSIFLG